MKDQVWSEKSLSGYDLLNISSTGILYYIPRNSRIDGDFHHQWWDTENWPKHLRLLKYTDEADMTISSGLPLGLAMVQN
jgi:hypothetical protein